MRYFLALIWNVLALSTQAANQQSNLTCPFWDDGYTIKDCNSEVNKCTNGSTTNIKYKLELKIVHDVFSNVYDTFLNKSL